MSAGLPGPATRAIVVMGVSGCGKSTVGQALADRLHWRFADADGYHPPANVAKMRAGMPLNDDDRQPWLERLNAVLRHAIAKDEPIVLACSALRERYRVLLRERIDSLAFVHLAGSFELIESRLRARSHEYMPASLLRSQFATLEPPADALVLAVDAPVDEIVERVAGTILGR